MSPRGEGASRPRSNGHPGPVDEAKTARRRPPFPGAWERRRTTRDGGRASAPRPSGKWAWARLGASWFFAMAVTSACSASAIPRPIPARALAGGPLGTAEVEGDGAFSLPLPAIHGDDERQFFRGRALFRDLWVTAPASTETRDGLGPIFNARSCAGCHRSDGRGRGVDDGAPFVEGVVRLSIPGPEGDPPLPEPTYGGQLQPLGVYGVPGEGTPILRYEELPGQYADGTPYSLRRPHLEVEGLAHGPLGPTTMTSVRVAPAMTGLGLLEGIDEAVILAQADPDDRDGDGISGRANWVPDVARGETRLGRFGWKANQPTILQQAAGAFGGDLGLTTRLFPTGPCTEPDEACRDAPSGGDPEVIDPIVDDVAAYSRGLAVPAPRDLEDPAVQAGEVSFEALGCADCHHPTQAVNSAPIAGLNGSTIWPYTDLLLHDLGPGLADGRPDFLAEGGEWRTSPLWGLGLLQVVNGHQTLLHDGRARGFAEAILWHGGEAEVAKEAFRQADAETRAALLAFLESL